MIDRDFALIIKHLTAALLAPGSTQGCVGINEILPRIYTVTALNKNAAMAVAYAGVSSSTRCITMRLDSLMQRRFSILIGCVSVAGIDVSLCCIT
jgi:hypothetical protein